MGARLLVFANVHLSPAPTAASRLAASEIARAIGSWSGPGAVVLAGGTFDLTVGQADVPGADVPGALDAHGALGEALREFSAGPGRRVVVLAGKGEAVLAEPAVRALLKARAGADVARAVVAELFTAGGVCRARIEPGDGMDASWPVPGPPAPLGSGHQRLADVFPGLWRGSTSGWLAGLGQLDDPSAISRFVASRLVYRQLGRRAWLLAVPVVLALLLRLPVALLRPARHVSGILLATTLGAAVVESVVLAALAVVSLRQILVGLLRPGGRTARLERGGPGGGPRVGQRGLGRPGDGHYQPGRTALGRYRFLRQRRLLRGRRERVPAPRRQPRPAVRLPGHPPAGLDRTRDG